MTTNQQIHYVYPNPLHMGSVMIESHHQPMGLAVHGLTVMKFSLV